MKKERLDKLLVARGLVESRQKAQALILAGRVFVDGERFDKPGKAVAATATVEVHLPDSSYVSRGGVKLEGALAAFNLAVTGAVCLDVGASTGGFTECLLRHGAACVYALDVGRGQLHWKLRSDRRVVVREGVNARYVKPEDFPVQFDLVTVDVSFISLTKVLPALVPLVKPGGMILALIKPQFEVGRGEVGPGGIVRDRVQHARVIREIQTFARERLHLQVRGVVASPIRGAEGNKEFFILLAKDAETLSHEVGSIAHRP
ncbi:MAG: TlyA family RNA methyltransferase [Acidobacteria bacterium]|nr:MAG: TlyA family RNA methyltransferase [Acidobacteriota bacterium]